MKLYMFPLAPNPTKVRLFLSEKEEAGCRIEIEQVLVNLVEGEQKTAEHRARHPFGKLPVLETDAGEFLTESLAIIEYLEECHPTPSLWGRTPIERAARRELERMTDLGVLIPIARTIHTTNSPLGLPPNPPVAQYFRESLPAVLDLLEGNLEDGRPFLAGDEVTVADCTLASALQFARFREMSFLDGYGALEAWDLRYRERPAAQRVLVA